jgi:gliding motility-associated-like protein
MRNCYKTVIKRVALLVSVFVFCLLANVSAQTTLTTLPNPPYNGGNSAGTNAAVTFVVENTNSFPILLNDVSTWLNTTDANGTLQLWYSSTSLSGTPTIATPTWTMINQVTNFPAPAANGITPVWNNLGFVIPGNTQYRFAVWYVNISTHYSGTGAGTVTPSSFSSGGVNLILGDVQIAGQFVGYGGVNNPRWFTGAITFQPALPCTTPPTPGAITSNKTNPVCTYDAFTLSLTGGTFGTGQTYLWQSSSSATGPWIPAAGTNTGSTYTNTQSVSTFYRCQVTCGSNTVASAAYQVVSTTCAPVYCQPAYTSGTGSGDFITLVQINGTTLNNPTGPSASPYYTLYPQSGSTTASLLPGVTYTMVLAAGTWTSTGNNMFAWIDYNENGTFEASELLGSVINAPAGPATNTFTFTVPTSVTGGLKRLRVREVYAANPVDPCASGGFGETEDYDITIVPLTPCSGTPNAGTANASQTNILCPGALFTLSTTGATVATGVTYQWQSSPDNTNWTNITGATNLTYTTTQSATLVYYRCVVTCSGGGTANSNVVQVTSVAGPSYGTLPFAESFENTWINGCDTRDIPTQFWKNTPATGNSSWRRHDDGVAAAAWTSNFGNYTPVSNAGLFSARFHSYNATTNSTGAFDLYLNCNTPDVAKKLEFDYINTSGNDSLSIQVSTDGGATFSRIDSVRSNASGWLTKVLYFNSTSATTVVRFIAYATDAFGSDIGLDNIKVSGYPNCTGAPSAGTATSTLTNITCPGASFTLNLSGSSSVGGLTYQWQSATSAAGPWTNIPTATTQAFTTTQNVASLFYRCVVTCTLSSTSSNSSTIQVTAAPPSYATLPYTESFENTWIDVCDTRDAPNLFWKNTPVTGNNSWRRNDDGAAAVWTGPALGAYAPTASVGNYSARFHSYNASSGTSGNFDLYLNCNTPDLTKKLEFDYINTSGNDSVSIQISTDGGVTFSRVDSIRVTAVWRTKTIFFNSASATTIVRFRATSDFGVTDIGIDNIKVNPFPTCTGTPTAGTATTSQSLIVCTGATFTLNLSGVTVAGALTYQWQSATSATGPWTNIAGAAAQNIPFTTTQTAATLFYRCIVTCGASGLSANSTAVQVNFNTTPNYATLPYFESFENTWLNGCGVRELPNLFWKNTPITGNTSWRRNDDGGAAAWASNNGAYTPPASDGNYSARFHSYDATSGTIGTLDVYLNCLTPQPLKRLMFDYINLSGADSITVLLSTDGGVTFNTAIDTAWLATTWTNKTFFFTSQSATTVIRFRARGDFGVTDIGIDNVRIDAWGNCNGKPVAGVASAAPTSACASIPVVLSTTGTSVGNGILYQWQQSTNGGTTWADIANGTTIPFSTTQLVTTSYRCVVRCVLSNRTDTTNALVVTSPPLPGGTYTINSSLPTSWSGSSGNFNSFNDAYNAIKCGISSSVVFNVQTGANAGTYTEQLIMSGAIPNASATRTVRFNGNGNKIKFQSSNNNERAVIKLRSIKYITFDNLVIDAVGGTYGFGVHLTADADSNTVKRCTILADANTTSTNFTGIAISGSDASATGTGTTTALCDYNIIDSNTVIGGYYGITQAATFAGGAHGYNRITNNRIQDFYLYGIYINSTYSSLIERNTISRPTRLSANLTTFYGIFVTGQSNDLRISKNRITNPFGTNLASTSAVYGIYHTASTATAGSPNIVSNNLIYGINGNGDIYALYNSSSGNIRYFHNTISLDSTASTSTGITRGFFQLGTSPSMYFYNNLISITRGGTSAKYCTYIASAFAFADNNNYFITPGATNNVGYFNANRTTLLDWQTALASFAIDQAAISVNPVFVDPSYAVANYQPNNAGMDNKGVNVSINDDILGVTRSVTTPDIGAYEFTPSACTLPLNVGATTISATTICENLPVVLNVNMGAYGGGQTFQWQASTTLAGPYTAIGAPKSTPDTTILASNTLYYQCVVKCGTTTATSAPVLLTVNKALPAGTYTINSAGPNNYVPGVVGGNFQTFNLAKASMGCGVTGTGNIIFNVLPGSNGGVYTEQLKLDSIFGVNVARQIIFNGNGNTIAMNTATLTTTERAVIKLNGADFITFDSLRINSISSGGFGHGVHLVNNADSNTFRKCVILASQTAAQSTTNYAAVVINATDGTATTVPAGAFAMCDGNVFDRDTISGGYYGISVAGGAAALAVSNNKFTRNYITDFYTYGIYVTGGYNTLIESNTLTRPTRTSVIGAYPIYFTGAATTRSSVSKNRITRLYGGAPNNTSGVWGIYHNAVSATAGNEVVVSNNLLYNLDGLGPVYGLYNAGSSNIFYFHNTISIENLTAATSQPTVGFYQTTLATGLIFKNNIITIRRASTAVKQGIVLATTTSEVESNNNDVLVTGSTSTNYFGTAGTANYTSLTAWRAGTNKDALSFSLDPLYTDTLNGNYRPLLAAIDNKGDNTTGITTDILNVNRSLFTPDLGAYEFTPVACVNPPVAGTASVTPNSGLCLEQPIRLTLTGTSPIGNITFQWQSSTTGGAPWTNFGGVSYSPTLDTVAMASPRFFRCLVTCGNGTPSVSSTTFYTLSNTVLPAGTYTIDATLPQSTPPYTPGANFQTFNNAINALLCGMNGNIVFNVKGVFTEQVRIPYVPGSGANATVIFQSHNGVPAAAELRFGSTSAANNYTLKLDSTRYFTFRNMTLTATNATNARVVEFANVASFDSLSRCVINAPVVTTAASTAAAVYSVGLKGTNVVVKGNTINNGSNGIYFSGNSVADPIFGQLIDSNIVNNSYSAGIYANFWQRPVISRNTINLSTAGAATVYGFFGSDCDSAYAISNNKVNISNLPAANTAYGIYLNNSDGSAVNRGRLTGNDVVATTANAGILYGIWIGGSPFASVLNNTSTISTTAASSYSLYSIGSAFGNYYNNSINSTATSATNNYAAYINAAAAISGINLKNNIFSHKAGGKALYIATVASVISNYNMLFTTGTNLVEAATPAGNYPTLQAWRVASYQDLFSIVYNPAFVSNADLRPNLTSPDVWAIHGRGVQIPGNNFDHDNASRPTTLITGVPDLGAYEFYPTALPVSAVATPATPAPNTQQVFMYGTDTVMKIKWGATAPASVSVGRYSGVVPTGLAAANLDSMYFYTKVDVPGNGNYNYEASIYYWDSWLGSIGGLTSGVYQLGLGKTTASFGTPWVVGASSRNEVIKRRIYQNDLQGANLDRFTGLLNPNAPPFVPDQDSSNRGRRFWVAYPNNQLAGGQDMVLYLSATDEANVQVKINGTTYVQNYIVPANTVISTPTLPKAGATSAYLATAGQYDRAISIESDVPIVAYAHTYGSASSGATMLMPVGTWGYEYKALCINGTGTYNDSRPYVYVIADKDNTVVNVTPSTAVENAGMAPNVTSTITLNKGEVFFMRATSATADITGTLVRSITNSAGQCFPAAVFTGNSRININISGCGSGGDFVMQQNTPSTAWGKRYLIAPTSFSLNAGAFATNVYRVAVKDPATVVTRNGVPLSPLFNNHYYEFSSNTADYIEADKPVMVAQFMGGGTCLGGSGVGDPEMMYISPIEQGIKSVGFYRNTLQNIDTNYLTMIIPTNGLSSLVIDAGGITTPTLVYPHPLNGTPSLRGVNYSVVIKRWKSAQQQVRVTSDSAFTGVTYGLGSVESYGYNMGTLIKNLGAVLDTFINGTTNSSYTCAGTPFKIRVRLPLIPTSITWRISQTSPNPSAISPNADVTVNNPVPSGTTFINGELFYLFTLPQNYVFSQPGLYTIPVTIKHPEIESCDNTLTNTLYVYVIPAPNIGFQVSFAGCQNNTATFTADNATSGGIGVNTWNWSFNNGTTATGPTATFTYTNAGTFYDTLRVVTSDGCRKDTVRATVVNPLPIVTVATDSLAICPNGTATFTASNQLTGTTYTWYTTPTGGTPLTTGGNYTISTNGTTITVNNVTASTVLYVQGASTFGCISATRKRVVINVLQPLLSTTVSVTARAANSVTFGWTAVANAVSYQVSVNGGAFITPSSGATGLSHTVTGLGILDSARVVVRANGLITCQSSLSNAIKGCSDSQPTVATDSIAVCTNNAPVTPFTAQPLPPNVTFSWYNALAGGTLLGTGSTYNPGAISTPLTSYNYYLQHTNLVTGCTSSLPRTKLTLNVLAPLAKPVVTVDTLTGITPTSLTFQWAAVPGAVGGYQVSVNGGPFVTPSSGTFGLVHVVGNLQPSTTVTVVVKAIGYLPCQESISNPRTSKTYTNQVYVPNAFNPSSANPDNRVLRIYGYVIKNLQFMVFNQWGEKVFETNNQSVGWDGNYKGKPLPSGVYIYVMKWTHLDGTVNENKGSISLIR